MRVRSLALASVAALATSMLAIAGSSGAAAVPTPTAPCGTGAVAPQTYEHVVMIMFVMSGLNG